jgi:hypothetical protein
MTRFWVLRPFSYSFAPARSAEPVGAASVAPMLSESEFA